ncbi:hypothetical protein BH20ACT15_BH20ACT15_12570 [soil metagenome]
MVVRYAGTPKPIPGPDATPMGWNRTKDGSFVASEPRGAPSWFPCNDVPTDKATFTTSITVPRGTVAVSNGLLTSVRRRRGKVTFGWREPEPMATYLATATTGRFRLRRHRVAGLPAWTAIAPALQRRSRRAVSRLGAVTRHMSAFLGPYPFSSNGVIADKQMWRVPPGDPGRKKIFAPAVYFRGAMALEALRELIGAAPFYETLRRWTAEHRYSNATIAQFVPLAEEVSGRRLDPFFRTWLFSKGKPLRWE